MIFLILSFLSRFLIYCIVVAAIIWFIYLVLVNNKVIETCFYDFYKINLFISSIIKLFIDFKLLIFSVYDIFV